MITSTLHRAADGLNLCSLLRRSVILAVLHAWLTSPLNWQNILENQYPYHQVAVMPCRKVLNRLMQVAAALTVGKLVHFVCCQAQLVLDSTVGAGAADSLGAGVMLSHLILHPDCIGGLHLPPPLVGV